MYVVKLYDETLVEFGQLVYRIVVVVQDGDILSDHFVEGPCHYRIGVVLVGAADEQRMVFERVYYIFFELFPGEEAVELFFPICPYLCLVDVSVRIRNPCGMEFRMAELQVEAEDLSEGTQHFVALETVVEPEPVAELYGGLRLVGHPCMVGTGQCPAR